MEDDSTGIESSKAVNPSIDFAVPKNEEARTEPLASPTKGILLTPGTVATRRKNVTFGGLNLEQKSRLRELGNSDKFTTVDNATNIFASTSAALPSTNEPPRTNLAKALYKAKMTAPQQGDISKGSNDMRKVQQPRANDGIGLETNTRLQSDDMETPADITVDLNEPRSRSGQHWKAELERYHKKSDREMKKIIIYGQNIKSYAAKRDSEASDLDYKLQKELVKVASMEKKVMRLAAQLARTQTDDSQGTSDQKKLFEDLSRQTALAVRYKQRAERYKRTMMDLNLGSSLNEDDTQTSFFIVEGKSHHQPTEMPLVEAGSSDLNLLRNELTKARKTAQIAERRAEQLEGLNKTLEAQIADLKERLSISDVRRQAQETSFKSNEAKLNAAHETTLFEIGQFKQEIKELQTEIGRQKTLHKTEIEKIKVQHNRTKSDSLKASDKFITTSPAGKAASSALPTPVLEHKSDPSYIDIWTQGQELDRVSTAKKPTGNLPTPSLDENASSILKEIPPNTIPHHFFNESFHSPIKPTNIPANQTPISHPIPTKLTSSTTKRTHDRTSTLPSPRASMFNFSPTSTPDPPSLSLQPTTLSKQPIPSPSPSPPQPDTIGPALADSTPNRSPSVPKRISTFGGGGAKRHPVAMSDERATAARKRLERRRIEKRRERMGAEAEAGAGTAAHVGLREGFGSGA